MDQLKRITQRHEVDNPFKRVAIPVERLAVMSEYGADKAYESVWRRYDSLEQLLTEYNDTFSVHTSNRTGRTYVRLISTQPRPSKADSGPPPLAALGDVVEPGASSTAMGANASRADVEKTYVSPSGEPDDFLDWSEAERGAYPSSFSEDIDGDPCSSSGDEIEPTMGSMEHMG